jgi:hypothetical protein
MKILTILIGLFIATAASAQTTKPAAPTTKPTKPSTNVPASDSLLNSMLKPSSPDSGRVLVPLPDPLRISETTGKAIAPDSPPVNLIREGSFVVDRTGRLTKAADGQQWEFTFDADGKAMQDPPLGILPNLKLMAMENAVAGSRSDLRFRITGMVTEYKGRNFILLEKVGVIPDQTQQF